MRISDWSSDVCSSDLHRFGQCVALHSILPILRDCLVMETAGTQFESTALAAIPLWNWCRQVLRLSTVGTSIFWPTPAERQRHGSSTTLRYPGVAVFTITARC